MKNLKFLVALFVLFVATQNASSAPIRFSAESGSFDLGYVEYDQSAFSGSGLQLVGNDLISDMSINLPGASFGFSDIIASGAVVFDLSGLLPRLLGSVGQYAVNGPLALTLGFDGSYDTVPPVGATSLIVGSSDPFVLNPELDVYPVRWTVETSVPGVIVAEPGVFGLSLLGLALLGLTGRWQRRIGTGFKPAL